MPRGQFEMSLRRFAQEAGETADAAVRSVALEVWSRVISRSTPVVDTGRFRANWHFGIDVIPTAIIEPVGDMTAPLPAAAPPTLGPGMGLGHTLYIVNTVPYARPLEYGHSAKGEGMVRTTIAEFNAIVDARPWVQQRVF